MVSSDESFTLLKFLYLPSKTISEIWILTTRENQRAGVSVHWEILQLQQAFSLDRQPEREKKEREGEEGWDFVLVKVVWFQHHNVTKGFSLPWKRDTNLLKISLFAGTFQNSSKTKHMFGYFQSEEKHPIFTFKKAFCLVSFSDSFTRVENYGN